MSISASGEIKEGDSVTLNCNSDSNPPALNFSWFKENQSSAVGSGQSFIISSFNSSHSGRYYCEAQNQYGSQRSASVSVSIKGRAVYLLTLLFLNWIKLLFSDVLLCFLSCRTFGDIVHIHWSDLWSCSWYCYISNLVRYQKSLTWSIKKVLFINMHCIVNYRESVKNWW